MVAYDLFEGVACEDDLVAAVVYSYPQFKKIFNKDIEEYKDFLISQENFLDRLASERPVRIVRVPFSEKLFAGWLAENSAPQGREFSRSAWALHAAKDPGLYRELTCSVPVFPALPFDEKFVVAVQCVVAPVAVSSLEAAETLEKRLPGEPLSRAAAALRGLVGKCPPLARKTALRCDGLALLVGDRFVAPPPEHDGVLTDAAFEDVAFDLMNEARALYINNRIPRDSGIVGVKARYRVRAGSFPFQHPGQGFVSIVFLPLVIAGASLDVNFAEKRLELEGELTEGPVVRKIGELVQECAGASFLQGYAQIVPWERALEAGEEVICILLDEWEDESLNAPKPRKAKKGRLCRIK